LIGFETMDEPRREGCRRRSDSSTADASPLAAIPTSI
jgi:hypothetical protein